MQLTLQSHNSAFISKELGLLNDHNSHFSPCPVSEFSDKYGEILERAIHEISLTVQLPSVLTPNACQHVGKKTRTGVVRTRVPLSNINSQYNLEPRYYKRTLLADFFYNINNGAITTEKNIRSWQTFYDLNVTTIIVLRWALPACMLTCQLAKYSWHGTNFRAITLNARREFDV